MSKSIPEIIKAAFEANDVSLLNDAYLMLTGQSLIKKQEPKAKSKKVTKPQTKKKPGRPKKIKIVTEVSEEEVQMVTKNDDPFSKFKYKPNPIPSGTINEDGEFDEDGKRYARAVDIEIGPVENKYKPDKRLAKEDLKFDKLVRNEENSFRATIEREESESDYLDCKECGQKFYYNPLDEKKIEGKVVKMCDSCYSVLRRKNAQSR